MKRIFNLSKRASYTLLIATLSMVVLLGACSTDDDPILEGEANFKIVNAVPDSNPQDFYWGDVKLTTGIAYGQSSDYETVQSGTRNAIFTDAGSTTATASRGISVPVGGTYTLFYDKTASGESRVVGLADELIMPASGKAHVRFIHLNEVVSGGLVISAGTETIANNKVYDTFTPLYVLTPGVDIKIGSVGSATPLVIPGASIAAGKIYTVWFDGTAASGLQYHLITHN